MLASITFKVLFVALKVNNEHNGKYILKVCMFLKKSDAVDIA